MECLKDPELDKLSQALFEVLEIQKCSVCLEKLEDTVLLWPCTHWFCSHCISKLQQSVHGEKIACPLCKGVNTRRSILPFDDKQKEYESYLQTLIQAISIDLGFDITSYKNRKNNETLPSNCKISENGEIRKSSSPVRKTRSKSPMRKCQEKSKPYSWNNKSKRVTRSAVLKNPRSKNENTSKTDPVSFLENLKGSNLVENKVKEWLDSTKFSQAEANCLTENVVVDIHKSELESLGFPDDQLQSVTQSDLKSFQTPLRQKLKTVSSNTPSDIEAIKTFDETVESKNNKRFSSFKQSGASAGEEFDQLLSPEKSRFITSTYKRNNSRNTSKRKCVAVDLELFKASGECNEKNEKLETENQSHLSQSSLELEDFSSGSGEEWTFLNKTKSNSLTKKNKLVKKNNENLSKTKKKENILKISGSKQRNQGSIGLMKGTKYINNETQSKCNIEENIPDILVEGDNISNNKLNHNLKQSKENAIKEITDDWDDSQDDDTSKHVVLSSDHQIACGNPNIPTNSVMEFKQLNQINQRSPGWSRLKTTKKEFHVSEKKKLSFKMLNKPKADTILINTDLSPLIKENKSVCESTKKTVDDDIESAEKIIKNALSNKSSPKNSCLSPQEILKEDSKKSFTGEENHSCSKNNSTLIQSPFKGFQTAEEKKEIFQKLISELDLDEKQQKINDNSLDSTVEKRIMHNKQEICAHDTVNKKRDRDYDIYDNSGFCSPVRKKMCHDVEVQTSPGHMQSFIKDMIKNMWGTDAEKIFENCFQTENLNITKFHPKSSNLADKSPSNDNNAKNQKNEDIFYSKPLSQDSDKENINDHSIPEKGFNDSDLVLGTEDNTSAFLRNKWIINDHKSKHLATATDEEKKLFKSDKLVEDVVDREALTQPYKTPVVHKQTLKTLSNSIYSAVSNPTDSEFKKCNDIFARNDEIFPDTTPILTTHWDDSGIDQLNDCSKKSVKNVLSRTPLKEKVNKSRRQLDFVEEDLKGKDNDTIRTELCTDDISYGQNEKSNVFTIAKDSETMDKTSKCTRKSTNQMDCIKTFIQNPNDSEMVKNSTCNIQKKQLLEEGKLVDPKFKRHSIEEEKQIQNELDIADDIIEDDDKMSIASSDDCFVQGTPDGSKIDMQVKKSKPTSVSKLFEEGENVEKDEQKERVTSNIQNGQLENVENEINENVENTQNSETEHFCFASSLLNKRQNDLLIELLKVLNIPFSKTVDQNISHLIVNAPDGHFQNTYKVLYAMVLRKQIIRYDWVEDVFRSGRLLSLDPYLAIDKEGNCGISRALKDKDRQLLHEFAIHVYSVDNQIIQKEQIEELIRLCGGMAVSELHQFHNVSRDLFRVIVVAETDHTLTQEVLGWRQKYAALDVVVNWIYDTIGHYRVAPLEHYITNPTDAVLFLRHEGYPENFIFGALTQE